MNEAWIGVIGTLAGTLLGWLLSQLSQRGKLVFFVRSFTLFKVIRNNEGGEEWIEVEDNERQPSVIRIFLQVSNTSAIHKVGYNISFNIGRVAGMAGGVDTISLAPYTTEQINPQLRFPAGTHIQRMDRIEINYVNAKGKLKTVILKR
jgi:hypothetical protein